MHVSVALAEFQVFLFISIISGAGNAGERNAGKESMWVWECVGDRDKS